MKQLVTSSWRALLILASLFVFTSSNAQQPCDITVSPSGEILFESVQGALVYKMITVTNTSANTVEVQVTTTGEHASAFSYDAKSFTLHANGKKEFKVLFKPTSANILRYGAVLNFITGNGVVCTQVELIGTGGLLGGDDKGLISDPGSYKYPAVDSGHESCKTFVIVNKSTNAAVISEIKIDGDESYVIDETLAFPITIEAGGQYSVTVCFRPDEHEDAYAKATVVVEYALSNSSEGRKLYIALAAGANSGGDRIVYMKPSQYQFPKTEVGKTTCADFVVTNNTTSAITVTGIDLEADAVFTFSTEQTLPFQIDAGKTATVKVCFTPTDSVSNGWKGSLSVAYTSDGGITTKHVTAVFYAMYEKPACLAADEGDDWTEPILIGGKDDRILVITNKTNADITINSIRVAGQDASSFTIDTRPPITIAAMGKVEIPFTFAPNGGQAGYIKEKYIAAVVLSLTSSDPNSSCGEFETHVWGYGLREHDKDTSHNSVAIALYGETKTIGLANRGIKESYTLLFVNNLDRDLIVQSISLADGSKFKIDATDPSTTPFTLTSQQTFTVTISFESADGLLYKDKLIIVTELGATAIEFDLQGINADKALSSIIRGLPEGVSVAVLPNPMRDNMTVNLEGIRSATIEVTDVLGSTIMRTVAGGDWKWNGRMASGAPAPAGTYFVRIQGESAGGEHFVTTQRIIIER